MNNPKLDQPTTPQTRQAAPVLVWWIIWAIICLGLVVIYFVIPPNPHALPTPALRYLPIGPLMLATVVRWFVLPRFKERVRAFPIFIMGIALAESCGILGMFLVPDLRSTFVILSLVGLAQFVPIFVSRLES